MAQPQPIPPPAPSSPSVPSPAPSAPSLPFKHLFNHFFLLHDFLHRLTKSKAHNATYFDLQVQIYAGMKNAVKTGSKVSQFVTFSALVTYCLKGNSIKLRFLYGFLFIYWFNHVMTLGQYAGIMCRMPHLYSRAAQYYLSHPQEKNLVGRLNQFMERQEMYEQPQLVLEQLFQSDTEEKSFVTNEFFVKNRDKYVPKEFLEWETHNTQKLPYFDSFFTRYVYYSFTRWCKRMGQFLSVYRLNQ